MEEHIQPLVSRQEGQPETVIKVHELLCTCRVWCVHFGVTSVGAQPEFRVTHCAQEVRDLLGLVLASCLDLQTVNLLKNLCFLVQELLQCQPFFVLFQLLRSLNLLRFVEAPNFELVVENVKVFALLRMHAALDLLLMLKLFFVTELGLTLQKLLVSVVLLLKQLGGNATGEPGSDATLNIQRGLRPFLVPHS